jgi:hypothetical protein
VCARRAQATLALLHGSDPRGWLQPRALRTLGAVASFEGASERGSAACFDCAGDAAGVVVDVCPPPCGGMTLTLWVRLEAPPLPLAAGVAASLSSSSEAALLPLFNLAAADGSGVCAAAAWDTGALVLRGVSATPGAASAASAAAGGGGAPAASLRALRARSSAGAVRPGAWCCVTLVMTRSLLSDGAVLYVNGTSVLHTSLPFPAALSEGAPQRLYLGCWGTKDAPLAQGLPPLQGQVGVAALFTHACCAEDVAALHAASGGGAPLAPPASALSDRKTAAAHGSRGAPLPAKLAEKGHKRMALALDPRGSCGSRLWGTSTRARPAPAGELLPGTRAVVTRTFSQAAAAAGGPALLLPLLLRAEHVGCLAPAAGEEEGAVGASAASALPLPPRDAAALLPLPPPGGGLAPASVAAALALLPPLLRAARPGEASACARGAAALLRAAPRDALTPHLAAALLEAVRALGAAAEARDGAAGWEAAALLLLDVPRWRAAQPPARRAHLAAIRAYLETAPELVAAVFGGEYLCTLLRGDDAPACDALPPCAAVAPDPGSADGIELAAAGVDECAAEERVALLRTVQSLAEGSRGAVRAAVARQFVRFIHGAAGEAAAAALDADAAPPASAPPPPRSVHPDALRACVQLLAAMLSREAAAHGGGRPLPPLVREAHETLEAPRGATALQLLQTGGGLAGAALTRRLCAHPDAAVASLGRDIRACVFNADVNAAAAAAAAVAHDPGVVGALLAGSPAGAAARAGASAAQAWAGERAGGGAFAWRTLRRLASTPGPWAPPPHSEASDAAEAALPGGRPYWRLDDAAGGDGGRRRLLPLERDGSRAGAARARDAPAPPPPAPLAADAPEALLPRASPRIGGGGADDAADEDAPPEVDFFADGGAYLLFGTSGDGFDGGGDADAEDDDEDDGDDEDDEDEEDAAAAAAAAADAMAHVALTQSESEAEAAAGACEASEAVAVPSPSSSPNAVAAAAAAAAVAAAAVTTPSASWPPPPEASSFPAVSPPSESDGGGGMRGGSAGGARSEGPLSRLKRAAQARAGAAASGMAARAAHATRRAAEALSTAKEASSRVALASELVTEQINLVHAVATAPAAAAAPPLPPGHAAARPGVGRGGVRGARRVDTPCGRGARHGVRNTRPRGVRTGRAGRAR